MYLALEIAVGGEEVHQCIVGADGDFVKAEDQQIGSCLARLYLHEASSGEECHVPFADSLSLIVLAGEPKRRTLSKDEWVYLFITRTNADLLYGIAQVKGVNGMVVLPDNWETPIGLTFKSGQQGWDDDYSHFQSFSAEQWSEMEKAGALFLPANGFRQGTKMKVVSYLAYYWSSTEMASEKAYYMFFDYMDLSPQSKFSRSNGCSVRLVKDLQ